jgi:ankyrin repeat protein
VRQGEAGAQWQRDRVTLGFLGLSMSRIQWRFLMASIPLAFLLGNAVVAAPVAAMRLHELAGTGDVKALLPLLGKGDQIDAPDKEGSTPLLVAVSQDHLDAAKLLLARGANANSANRYRVTPLYVATLHGNTELMTALLAAKADPNAAAPSGETMLMTAARTGLVKAMQLLISAGARVDAREPAFNQTALMLAARGNSADAVAFLLDNGADINARTTVGENPPFVPPCKGTGCGSEGVGINRGGLPDRGRRDAAKGGMTSLLYAAREGADAATAVLIKRGANLDLAEANGMTPLLMALLNNQLGPARQLIDAGANVNADDFYGRTPLWAAVEYRNLDMNTRSEDSTTTNDVDRAASLPVIRLLIEKGANVNARTREVPPSRKWRYALNDVSWVDYTGQTPFLRAAFSGDTTVMRLLLEHGADPNLATQGGTTPLMAASGVGWVVQQTYTESMPALLEAIRICLEHKSDVNAVNSMGLTALLGAANKGANDIIKLLVANGARLDAVDKHGRDAYRWAGGIFLAAVGAEAKPHTIALLDELNHRTSSSVPTAQTPVPR